MNLERKKAFGYRRVSTDEQIDGMSLYNQERAIKNYADAHNFELVHIYSDEGMSAKNARRPQLQEMLVSFKEAGVTELIIYNMSRLSRDMSSYHRDIGFPLGALGVKLHSTQENINDTPEGQMMKNFALTLHQYDNDLKSKVTKDNMELVAREGWWQGRIPYGYTAIKVPIGLKSKDGKVKTRLTLSPDNHNDLADKIKMFLERFSQGRITQTELSSYAESINLPSATGGRFTPQSVKNMLTYSVYSGYIKNKLTSDEFVKAKHDGLISLETYQRNQDLLSGVTPRSSSPRFTSEYPLKHSLLCDSCRKPLTGSAPRSGGGGRSPRYHCTRCKGEGSISTKEMDGLFQGLLEQITPTAGTVRLFKTIVRRTAAKKLSKVNEELGGLRQELTKIDNDINKATQSYLDDNITKDEKESYQQSRRADRIDLEGRIYDLEGVQRLNEGTIDYVCNFIDKPVKMWSDADMKTKVLFQEMIIPGGIEFNIKERKFGTNNLSALYRLKDTQKASEEASESLMVIPPGIEPELPG